MLERAFKVPGADGLHAAVAKNFRGGLNTFDTPLNLNTKYLIELRNLYPDTNGRLRLRFGTSLFGDLSPYFTSIIASEYYAGVLIIVGSNGKIVALNAAGAPTLIWSTAIAATRSGSPAGWSTGLTFASFTQFSGQLVICNGVDKPLICNETFTVNYLADAGTGSNVNVPRARYCTTHNNYLVLAVTPDDTTTLFIGMRGTAGTFLGDPGVDNDAIDFPTDTYINRGSPDINGLGSFRDRLVVGYGETILALQLGNYVSTKHVPLIEDAITGYGCISHRCIQSIGDDVFFMDQAGVTSLARATLTQYLTPVRENVLISADMFNALSKFSLTQMSNSVFSLHDRSSQHILFFVPKSSTVTDTTDNEVFVYCFDKTQKLRAWTRFDNMAYRCGARSADGRIFLCSGSNVYYYHNLYEPNYNDYAVTGPQAWSDGTSWDDGTDWNDPAATPPTTLTGAAIPFAFSLPWSDMHATAHNKFCKYLLQDVEGDGAYTVEMFIDRLPLAELSMAFAATSEPEAVTLGVRPANNEGLYAWSTKFHRMRLRVSGSSNNFIAFVALGLMFQTGSMRR